MISFVYELSINHYTFSYYAFKSFKFFNYAHTHGIEEKTN